MHKICADIVKCVCSGVELVQTNFIIFAHILCTNFSVFENPSMYLYSVPGGKVNILGGHSIGHSKQKCLYEHVSYSERFPR